jgi:hypothetical protein
VYFQLTNFFQKSPFVPRETFFIHRYSKKFFTPLPAQSNLKFLPAGGLRLFLRSPPSAILQLSARKNPVGKAPS